MATRTEFKTKKELFELAISVGVLISQVNVGGQSQVNVGGQEFTTTRTTLLSQPNAPKHLSQKIQADELVSGMHARGRKKCHNQVKEATQCHQDSL